MRVCIYIQLLFKEQKVFFLLHRRFRGNDSSRVTQQVTGKSISEVSSENPCLKMDSISYPEFFLNSECPFRWNPQDYDHSGEEKDMFHSLNPYTCFPPTKGRVWLANFWLWIRIKGCVHGRASFCFSTSRLRSDLSLHFYHWTKENSPCSKMFSWDSL